MKQPKRLGRYDVLDLIGRGGMGSLYRARDPQIGRFVAIKVLREDFDTAELRERFAQEARSVGALNHPNILTIYDIGEYEGLPFIAMEYLPGKTFADIIVSRPPLPLSRKLEMIEEVCEGLAHAHRAGIIHRDIKPPNLMEGPDGTVKILDFGIAKIAASALTDPGVMMGTLNYMSPEQVTTNHVDARSDIFAVGAVLYELLTWRQAFSGASHHDVLRRIVESSPAPLSNCCDDLDPRIVPIVDRMLEKRPDRRFQDVATVQAQVARVRLTLSERRPRLVTERPASSGNTTTVQTPPRGESARRTPWAGVSRDLAKLREERITTHLRLANQSLEAGAFEAARESCEQVLVVDATHAEALALLERIHVAADEQELQQHLQQARDALSREAWEQASLWLRSASGVAPDHPLVAQLRDEISSARAQARAAAVRAALARGEAKLATGDVAGAFQEADHALSVDPQAPAISGFRSKVEAAELARREQARIRAVVEEARHRFDQGEHERSLQLLNDIRDTQDPLVEQALNDLRAAYMEIESRRRAEGEKVARAKQIEQLTMTAAETARRERKIAVLLERAAKHLETQAASTSDLIAAANAVAEALRLDPDHAGAQALESTIQTTVAKRSEQDRISTAVKSARQLFAQGQHQAALFLLGDFSPADQTILDTREELRGAYVQNQQRQRDAELRLERQRRASALMTEVRDALRATQFGTALEKLAKICELDATYPDLATLVDEATAGQRTAAATRAADNERRTDDASSGEADDGHPELPLRWEPAASPESAIEADAFLLTPLVASRSAGTRERLDQHSEPLWVATARSSTRPGGRWRLESVIALVSVLTVGLGVAIAWNQGYLSSWRNPGPTKPLESRAPIAPLPRESSSPTFTVAFTGSYPFELILPEEQKRLADNHHEVVLPAGSHEVRLVNKRYFLDQRISVDGKSGESKAFEAPQLDSLLVLSNDESCEIFVDGIKAGYHPLNLKVAVGKHVFSVRCPNAVEKRKTVDVSTSTRRVAFNTSE